MSLLFSVEGKVVMPTPQTLLISPFKEIWARDKSKDKHIAIEEFSYIEFMTSVQKSNPYSGYGTDKREEKILSDVMTIKDWQPDDLVKEGMAKLIEFQKEASVTYNYYMSAKMGAEKMQNFFLEFDFTACNLKTGAPIYKPKDITSALNDTSRVLENLNTLREKVDNEIFEEVKKKGQKIVSPFADPNSIEV